MDTFVPDGRRHDHGFFYLVTNWGEEIPYEFHVEVADAGKTLGDLKTAEDFLHVAENDMETALHFMEDADFAEALFMQDRQKAGTYDCTMTRQPGESAEEFRVLDWK